MCTRRLIPARAGNIYKEKSCLLTRTAHPRSRGEHTRSRLATIGRDGSSPLARGTYMSSYTVFKGNRLIPARAGNIQSRIAWSLRPTTHPRSRGEHSAFFTIVARGFGSSPLARGTCPGRARRGSSWRLIPARAGNIGGTYLPRMAAAAHPRSRGEHCFSSAREMRPSGSSPLARGTSHQKSHA